MNMKRPCSSAEVVRAVSPRTKVIFAPGITAPLWSSTIPLTVTPAWAAGLAGKSNITNKN